MFTNNDVLPRERELQPGHIGRLNEQWTSPKANQIGMNENGGLSAQLKDGR